MKRLALFLLVLFSCRPEWELEAPCDHIVWYFYDTDTINAMGTYTWADRFCAPVPIIDVWAEQSPDGGVKIYAMDSLEVQYLLREAVEFHNWKNGK
jgi:hypothetical protein